MQNGKINKFCVSRKYIDYNTIQDELVENVAFHFRSCRHKKFSKFCSSRSKLNVILPNSSINCENLKFGRCHESFPGISFKVIEIS